jgi:hypothetical protein
MTSRPSNVLVLLVLLVGASVRAAETGHRHMTFAERSPLSPTVEQAKRLGWSMQQIRASELPFDYDLEDESYKVFVPESYVDDKTWGMFVWVSPSNKGTPVKEWLAMLEKRKLIWVAPNGVGNKRTIWIRLGLALDAVHNAKKVYRLDPKRVYVGGFSGGGRIASIMPVAWPDVFAGGIYMMGSSYYRQLPAPGKGGAVWRATYRAPPGQYLAAAKKDGRHVFFTGETDQNRDLTKVISDEAKKDGFKHVTYIEVPGLGHRNPPVEWMEKAFAALIPPGPATAPAGKK